MAGAVPKPKAGAERVEDLVALVMAGTLRIPQFQRPLEWSAADVVTLLESIYLGYPVGSLLFHRRAAEAQVAAVGPVKVAAPELSSARWVVDGQQRLIALAASLRRPEPIPSTPDDAFVVYFDPTTRSFQSPPETGEIPTTWVPGPLLLDASRLMEWLFQWPHAHERTLREAVIQAGAELRESTIPTYTVETDDVDVLRAIYHRINRHGNHLEWHEVHDALYGSRPGRAQPSTLTELADALADVGIGRPSEHDQLLRCLFAFEGHERDDLALHEGTIAAALPTLRRVLGFLRSYAGIPHLRLLPSFASLPILTRLFRLHPEPNPRTLDLLRRWLWRGFLSGAISPIHAVDEDEEASVARLLGFVPKQPPPALELSTRFNPQSAESRIALLGLVSLGPRDPHTGRELDVADLIEEAASIEFCSIVGAGSEVAASVANRVILPDRGLGNHVLVPDLAESILRSHAISPAGAQALAAGDAATFLAERKRTLEQRIAEFGAAMAEWSSNDRPSIDYLLAQMESEHGAAV